MGDEGVSSGMGRLCLDLGTPSQVPNGRKQQQRQRQRQRKSANSDDSEGNDGNPTSESDAESDADAETDAPGDAGADAGAAAAARRARHARMLLQQPSSRQLGSLRAWGSERQHERRNTGARKGVGGMSISSSRRGAGKSGAESEPLDTPVSRKVPVLGRQEGRQWARGGVWRDNDEDLNGGEEEEVDDKGGRDRQAAAAAGLSSSTTTTRSAGGLVRHGSVDLAAVRWQSEGEDSNLVPSVIPRSSTLRGGRRGSAAASPSLLGGGRSRSPLPPAFSSSSSSMSSPERRFMRDRQGGEGAADAGTGRSRGGAAGRLGGPECAGVALGIARASSLNPGALTSRGSPLRPPRSAGQGRGGVQQAGECDGVAVDLEVGGDVRCGQAHGDERQRCSRSGRVSLDGETVTTLAEGLPSPLSAMVSGAATAATAAAAAAAAATVAEVEALLRDAEENDVEQFLTSALPSAFEVMADKVPAKPTRLVRNGGIPSSKSSSIHTVSNSCREDGDRDSDCGGSFIRSSRSTSCGSIGNDHCCSDSRASGCPELADPTEGVRYSAGLGEGRSKRVAAFEHAAVAGSSERSGRLLKESSALSST